MSYLAFDFNDQVRVFFKALCPRTSVPDSAPFATQLRKFTLSTAEEPFSGGDPCRKGFRRPPNTRIAVDHAIVLEIDGNTISV